MTVADLATMSVQLEKLETELAALEQLEEELDTIASDNAWDTFRNMLSETI